MFLYIAMTDQWLLWMWLDKCREIRFYTMTYCMSYDVCWWCILVCLILHLGFLFLFLLFICFFMVAQVHIVHCYIVVMENQENGNIICVKKQTKQMSWSCGAATSSNRPICRAKYALIGTRYLLLLEDLLACTRDNVPYSIYSCDYPRCCL